MYNIKIICSLAFSLFYHTAFSQSISPCESFKFTTKKYHQKESIQDYLSNKLLRLDESGIIEYNYGDSHNAGWQKTPIVISKFMFYLYELHCEDLLGEEGYSLWLDHANWLLNQASYDKGFATWKYNFPIPDRSLKTGWDSGLGNAMALVAVAQYFQFSNDQYFISLLTSGINGFELPLKDGDYKVFMERGGIWFEEYPNKVSPSHVLNGHIISLLALEYVHKIYPIEAIKPLLTLGILAVELYAQDFDNINTTYYSLKASKNNEYALPRAYWQYIHEYGLTWLVEEKGKISLKPLLTKWSRYIENNIKIEK